MSLWSNSRWVVSFHQVHQTFVDKVQLFEDNVLSQHARDGQNLAMQHWMMRITMDVLYASMFAEDAKALDPRLTVRMSCDSVREMFVPRMIGLDVFERRCVQNTQRY